MWPEILKKKKRGKHGTDYPTLKVIVQKKHSFGIKVPTAISWKSFYDSKQAMCKKFQEN